MKWDRSRLLLYAVTDRAWIGERTLKEQVEEALRGGATCIQLREKNLTKEALLAEALEIRPLCQQYHVPLIINDHADVALAAGADGVHVGQEDTDVREIRRTAGDRLIIGVSAHTVEEAVTAERSGADYLGIGAVFPTGTKSNVTAMPLETLRAICAAVSIPKVAIGGIHASNAGLLAGSGIDGIAVVSGIFGAPDPRAAAEELLRVARKVTDPEKRESCR